MHRLSELVRLHRQGVGAREAARLLGMSPNTERRYREALKKRGLLDGKLDELPELETLKGAVAAALSQVAPPQQQSSIEPFVETIARMRGAGLGPQAIHDRLRLEDDQFRGSISSVKRLCARLRRQQGPRAEDVAIPVVTAPGEVAQVDFGYAGKLWDPDTGRARKAWVFVMVLGHSRHRFDKVVFDQKQETWCRLHEEAFRHFGGVVSTVVPDNLKSAVIRAAFATSDRQAELNRSYRELARHYGFRVDPTPPRAPRKKGKVESGVRYVKQSALVGRSGEPIDEVNRALREWDVDVAGMRVHGTTAKRPLEVFRGEEKRALSALPAERYEPVFWKQATVHRDSHVVFERHLYSVPWQLIGKKVWVRATRPSVVIYFDDERVATHRRSDSGLRSTVEEHLPEGRRDLRHRSQEYWEARGARVGANTGEYAKAVFASDDVLYQLRAVQSIVTLLEKYPKERAEAASKRALLYGITSYQGVKNILRHALDREPLPTSTSSVRWADAPTFARDPSDFVQGGSDEHH